VPKDGEPGADTWGHNPASRKHGGGNFWTPMSFDGQKNLLYVPGGNAAPDLYDDDRPGDDLYTNSLIGVRLVKAFNTLPAAVLAAKPELGRGWGNGFRESTGKTFAT
jgi:hypothetical protein